MSLSIEEQIQRLKNTIAEMEAQREILGDGVVEKALEPLSSKLAELRQQLEASKTSTPGEIKQQRKLLTLLFMDVVGSTSMIQHMDPEDVSEVLDRNIKRLALPVEDHGGRITSFRGDGFMAVFGAPVAREDDPERAVRAGLAVLDRAEEISQELEQKRSIHDFKVRVGINTGLVILGGDTEGEDTTKGPAVHLAARLQDAAPPGGLLVSYDTYRHIRGVFDVDAWEPLQVKGFDEPVQVYRILNAKPRAFRSYTRGVEGVETRMVGRHDELKYLQDALMSAIEEGEGQLVTIMGEAGVGKSRLLYEFLNWSELLPPPSVLFYEGRAHQEAQGMPLAMLRNVFEFRFQLQETDSKEAMREKVEAGFEQVFGRDDSGQMHAHLLGQWLGFDFSTSPHLKAVVNDPEQLRNRGQMYLDEYFKGLCAQGPTVVILEELHWADNSSLDTLNWLGERFQHKPMLFVCAARHSLLERRPFWGEGMSYHHRLDLEPLSRRESHELVREILKLTDHVPAELYDLVVEGAEGNPFYVEELVKMLVEDGVVVKGEESWRVLPGRLSEVKVPPTLAGVLQARLESLPPDEQQVLQQASVVGRLFWDQVVKYIQSAEGGMPQDVSKLLGSLRGREMVYRREASAFADSSEYLFKHDILREVTYESVLKRLRRKYHSLVADWLINQVAGRVMEFSGLIAGHLLQADRKEEAGEFFLQAGKAALGSYANHEAEKYFRHALEQPQQDYKKAVTLAGLGEVLFRQGTKTEAVDRIKQGIEIVMNLGDLDYAASLYARMAYVQWMTDYQAAWESCQEGLSRLEGAPESPGKARLLADAGRAAFFVKIPHEQVNSLCQRAIAMAERQGDVAAKAEAEITLGMAAENMDQAIHIFDWVVRFCEANQLWDQARRAHGNLAVWHLNLETAYQHSMQAIDISLRTGNVEILLFDLRNLSFLLSSMGYMNTVVDKLREILRNSTVPQSRIDDFLQIIDSEQLAWRGEWSEALESIHRSLEESRRTTRYQEIGNYNFVLADVYLQLSIFTGLTDLSEAENAMKENIELGNRTRFPYFVLARLAARQGRLEEARRQLNEAIAGLSQPIGVDYEMDKMVVEVEIAQAEGRWDEAISIFRALIAKSTDFGNKVYEARALVRLGDALKSRDQAGDREEAEQAYRRALEMFTQMDTPGYIQVLEERLQAL